jgi:ribosomal protein L11 methylase PrmA
VKLIKNPGSFRDPSGQVYSFENRIIRVVKKYGNKRFQFLETSKLIEESIQNNFLIESKNVTNEFKDTKNQDNIYIEHKKIDYISYPYEWGFYQLKDAALLHLNFQLFLLEKNAVLIDSSAYNVQFYNNKPIFIDLLSIDEYNEGDYWKGHSQFLQQFLNPLLLSSLKGIDYNNWYKGNLNGIETIELNKLLNLKDKFSLNVFFSVTLLARLEVKNKKNPKKALNLLKNKKSLSKNSYKSILLQLKNWIEKLEPLKNKTIWDTYSSDNTYEKDEENAKLRLVNNFSKTIKPYMMADVGCNDGLYSFESLKAGAKKIIGFDIDLNTINRAYLKSKKENLNFLPLFFDAMNPSCNLGWNESERSSFSKRLNFDAVIALAFEHHLALANNVPLDQTIKWLTDIAPKGLIEFVDKEDETIKRMLSIKGDIFPNYSIDSFEENILLNSKIVNKTRVSKTRIIYEFSKN